MSASLINKFSLVSDPPTGDFIEISALKPGWFEEIQIHLRQQGSVKYDHYPLPKFPDAVLAAVTEHGYEHLILANDRWQHFFIPPKQIICSPPAAETPATSAP